MKINYKGMAVLIVLGMCLMTGCKRIEEAPADRAVSKENSGSVYYLNPVAEHKEQWEEIAEEYTKQTGVRVKVVTAAENQYGKTLKSEMEKEESPTIFTVKGNEDVSLWADNCFNLGNSAAYKNLYNTQFSLRGECGEVFAVAYDIESYGIIYNKELLSRYCELEGAVIESAEEIKSFDTLRAVAEDIQENREVLSVKGAFTSFGLASGSADRFTFELANVPVYYELKGRGTCDMAEVSGEYLGNLEAVWDMYMSNSTCGVLEQVPKTLEDAVKEFSRGQAVFFQSGTKVYEDIVKEGIVDEDALGMLPLYIGVAGEKSQGLCTGVQNYWCVNSKARKEDIRASVSFLEWIITSEEGKEFLCEELCLSTPFATFSQEERIRNPLGNTAVEYMDKGYVPVTWYLTPNEDRAWCDAVTDALCEYTQGRGDWSAVTDMLVSRWVE